MPDILTVSQVTARIRQTLETGFRSVWVEGEASNVRHHTSGHLYFSLKDEGAQISAVMWRSRVGRLSAPLSDGMRVVVRGGLTVYPPRGSYQIDVEHIQLAGVGELQRRFEELKARLQAEGLFDAARKRPIPSYPERIGVVTSESGAAFQDICTVLARRMPSVEVVLDPARVQGPGAAEEIAAAIDRFSHAGAADVLIVGRGGGSIEDLWAFNEEVVARAIARCRIPVISAVGHDVDFTIADFVADLRAPTPSAAAELAVRDRRELIELVGNLWYTLRQQMQERHRAELDRLARLAGSYALNRPLDVLRSFVQRLDDHDRRLQSAATRAHRERRQGAVALAARLASLNPRSVLRRGYAIVRVGGAVRPRASDVHTGDEADIEFFDGVRKSTITT